MDGGSRTGSRWTGGGRTGGRWTGSGRWTGDGRMGGRASRDEATYDPALSPHETTG